MKDSLAFLYNGFTVDLCRHGEMVDTRDLKSLGHTRPCWFESNWRHHPASFLAALRRRDYAEMNVGFGCLGEVSILLRKIEWSRAIT